MSVDNKTDRAPLYEQVRRALRAAIEQSGHAPGTPFVTEREVCRRFGVSSTTAVRALNELVAEGVLVRRQGVGTFIAERPAEKADAEAPTPAGAHRKPTVACILQNHSSYISQLLMGLETTCTEHGYRLFLTHCNDRPERERTALQEALNANVSGIVLYPAEGGANADALAEVRRRGVPLVMIDRYRPDLAADAVVADNVAVGYEVTQELIRMGHRRIATLWSETECTSVRDRLTGHLQALRNNDIPIHPELTVLRRYVGLTEPGQSGTLETLLADPDPPSVLLCANGFTLAHAVADLAAMSVDVPGQVDLAGMDDAGPFDILPLTVVAASLPATDIGREAALLLHHRVTSGEPYKGVKHLVLPIKIRTRHADSRHLGVVPATSTPEPDAVPQPAGTSLRDTEPVRH
ncbi:GntR family transcriptional regulator [Actinopolymorpha sp. B11F2]|uniref:GntR family transcriptional regulator n=1 Tax=Actinopolymorpha sp. B11F2 TaxID=3160862 RepID=UPI0032E48CBE